MANLKRVSLLMFVLGIAGLAVASYLSIHNWPIANGNKATGKVVHMDTASGHHGGSKPVVEFRAKGKAHHFTGTVSSYPAQYHIGDSVKVRYVADEPSRAGIDKFQELWLIPAIFFPAGIMLLFTGIGILALSKFLGGNLKNIDFSGGTTSTGGIDIG